MVKFAFAGIQKLTHNMLLVSSKASFREYQGNHAFKIHQNIDEVFLLALQEHGYFGSQASHYCRLCQALNYNSREQKTVASLKHFFGKDHCRPSLQGVLEVTR